MWQSVEVWGWQEYTKSPGATETIVRSVLAAFPYLHRLEGWTIASEMLGAA